VASASAKDVLTGKLEQVAGQARTRRGGSTHWSQRHEQQVMPVSSKVTGSELTLTAEEIDNLFKDGLHVRIHAYDPLMRVLMPPISEVQVPVLGVLVILLMLLVEARVGDAKTKTHLVMAAAVTTVFSANYYAEATQVFNVHEQQSLNLVRPGLGALFNALVFG